MPRIIHVVRTPTMNQILLWTTESSLLSVNMKIVRIRYLYMVLECMHGVQKIRKSKLD